MVLCPALLDPIPTSVCGEIPTSICGDSRHPTFPWLRLHVYIGGAIWTEIVNPFSVGVSETQLCFEPVWMTLVSSDLILA